MVSLNIIVVTAVFIVVLIIVAVFVAQQFATVQKTQAKKSMSLSEKLSASGITPLIADQAREITVDGTPSESDPNRLVRLDTQPVFDQPSETAPAVAEDIESPEKMAFSDPDIAPELLDIKKKDLQSLYSHYLTEKSLNPFDVEPDFKLGLAYLQKAQYEKAQNLFQKVIEGDPEFSGIYYYLGEAYRCNGQFFEAMQAYKQSWETDHLKPKIQSDEGQNTGNDAELGV